MQNEDYQVTANSCSFIKQNFYKNAYYFWRLFGQFVCLGLGFLFYHLFTYLLCRQLCCLQIDCLCISFYCLHVLAVTSSSLLNMSGKSSYSAPAMTCFSYCRKIIESGRRNTFLLLHYYEYFWFVLSQMDIIFC